MPFVAGGARLSVRTVKAAGSAFIGAKRRALTELAGGSAQGLARKGRGIRKICKTKLWDQTLYRSREAAARRNWPEQWPGKWTPEKGWLTGLSGNRGIEGGRKKHKSVAFERAFLSDA